MAIVGILAIIAALGFTAWVFTRPKPPEKPVVGEPSKVAPTAVRHPEVPVEEAYAEVRVEPTSQTELEETVLLKQPIVSPVIDVEETTENRAAIEAIEDAEEAKLMALPPGNQCTKTFLDEKGNYYACVNGYAVLTIRAVEPEKMEEKKEEIRTTGTVEKEPVSWMEKELLEQERTGYTQVQRNKMVYDYRMAHPGVSGSEAYKILFGTYLGR